MAKTQSPQGRLLQLFDEKNCYTIQHLSQSLDYSLISENSDNKKVYQAVKYECDACPYRLRCCNSKKGEPRTINTDDKEPLRQKMNEKMEQESSKEIYKKRKKVVEPVFGQIKNRGF